MCLLEPLWTALHRRSGHASGLRQEHGLPHQALPPGLCTSEPELGGALLTPLSFYLTTPLSLGSTRPSDNQGAKKRDCVSVSLGLCLGSPAVWFLLSTCLANWKLLNSVTSQTTDAPCSLKNRERKCWGDGSVVNAARSLLLRTRSQTPTPVICPAFLPTPGIPSVEGWRQEEIWDLPAFSLVEM